MPRVAVDFDGNIAGIDKSAKQATQILFRFEAQAKSISKSVNTAFSAIGVGISVAGFSSFIKANIDMADHINDLSKSTKIAVGDLAGLSLAAKQSGGDLDGTAEAINKLSVNIGKDAEKYRALGISAKSPLLAFAQLADVLNGIEDAQTRAAVANAALGKSWQQSEPLLAEGGDAIRKLVKDGKELAKGIEELAPASDKFNDELEKIKAAVGGVGIALAGPIVKNINNLIEHIKEATLVSGGFFNVLKGIKDYYLHADLATPDEKNIRLNDAILEQLSKIKNIKSGVGFDHFFGDLETEQKKLDELVKTRKELLDAQKKIPDSAKAVVPPTKTDAFLGKTDIGKADSSKKEAAVVFNNEQLAKSEAIINRLTASLKLTREQASGFVGNFFVESQGLKTNIKEINPATESARRQGGGFGLAQWTGERQKQLKIFAAAMGKDIGSLDLQVDFLIKELTETKFGKATLTSLKKINDVNDAALVVRRNFEKPAPEFAHDEKRIAAAKVAFLGGLTESERRFDLTAEQDALKKTEQYARDLQEVMAGFQDKNIGLSEAQVQIAEMTASAYERLGLSGENLTEQQKLEKAAILEAAKAHVFNTEKMKLEEEQAKKLVQAFGDAQKLQTDIANIADGLVSSEDLSQGLGQIQDALSQGIITPETAKKLQDQIGTEFNKSVDVVQAGSDKMSVYAEQAARNMQDSFANFLFDPFKGGVTGMLDSFADALRQMAAQYLSSQLFDYLKGAFGGGSGGGDSGLGSIVSSLLSAVASYDVGTPNVPRDGLAFIHKDERIIPAAYNRRGEDPWARGSNAMSIVQHITVGNNADRDMVKRAAGQGAREGLAAMSGAQRYR